MSMPHTCVCDICRREMGPLFFGMDMASKPGTTAFWCTKHGPIGTILPGNKCPKCLDEETAKSENDGRT